MSYAKFYVMPNLCYLYFESCNKSIIKDLWQQSTSFQRGTIMLETEFPQSNFKYCLQLFLIILGGQFRPGLLLNHILYISPKYKGYCVMIKIRLEAEMLCK